MKTTLPVLMLTALVGCDQAALLDSADSGDPGVVSRSAEAQAPPRPADLDHVDVVDVVASLTITTDRGNDGTIDTVRTTWFDRRGDRRFQEDDRDGDGVLDEVTAWTYVYEDGLRVRTETDDGDDGTVDSVETRTYGAAGQLLRVELDEGLDGTLDRVETHRYDVEGRRVQLTVDDPVGGELETDQTWVWEGGRAQVRTMRSRGKAVPTRYTTHYGTDGRVASIEIDLGDGRPANRVTRTYDDHGRLAAAHTDANADGTVDTITTYGYDDDGRLVSLDIDADADGRADTVTVRTYRGYEHLRGTGGCR